MIFFKKTLFLTLLSLIFISNIFSQNLEESWSRESFTPNNDSTNSTFFTPPAEEIVPMGMQRKMDFDMEVGTSFTTNLDGAWSNSTWFSPHIHYKISPKFSISGGARIVKNNMLGDNDPLLTSDSYYPYFYQSSYVYVRGDYQVNNKLSLNAALYKSFNLDNSRRNSQFQPPEGYGANFGLNYQISEKSRIELQIGVSRYEYKQFPRINGDNNFIQFDEENPLFLNQNSSPFTPFFR